MELGTAYYPDYIYPSQSEDNSRPSLQWAAISSQIDADIERMHRLGLSLIRMGEFSWSHVEPEPGVVNFQRFIYALNLAQKFGIRAILCTPTATPPKWLVDRSPDILPTDRQGRRIPFGGRRHYDPASEIFRSESRRITTLYAKALGEHPAVIGWQTDNEIGNHSSWQSFTPAALRSFRSWLKKRYSDDIDALNQAWFTCFWSMHFRHFDEIELPNSTWTAPNPHLELDFRRFMTEVNCQFQREQIDILREHSPGRFVTHNITPMLFDLDLWRFCSDLDRVGYDHYQMEVEPDPVSSSSQFALMRSLGNGRPFLVLEQQPLQVNWQRVNRRFAMDWLLLWGGLAAFQGAEAMLYFSWRRFSGGSEQFHDAIIPHDRRVTESRQEKIIKAKLAMIQSFKSHFSLTSLPNPAPQVLFIHDIESIWTHENPAQSEDFQPVKSIESLQRIFMSRGYGICMSPSLTAIPLEKFAVIVLPGHAFALSHVERDALVNYLKNGGKALSLARSGLKNRFGQMVDCPLELFGHDEFYFDDYGALLASESETVKPRNQSLAVLSTRLWAEKIIIPNNSPWTTLADFKDGLYRGSPAAIAREIGNGRHLHLAFWPEIDAAASEFIFSSLEVESEWDLEISGDVQWLPLQIDGRNFFGAINFKDASTQVYAKNADKLSFRGICATLDDDLNLHVTHQHINHPVDCKIDLPARSVSLWERHL